MPPLIVFSDLDGTLLDHHSYRWDAAEPALEALRRNGIPLILASSKTADEMGPLRARLGFAGCPAIVENGAGVLPPNIVAVDADDYGRLRTILEQVDPALRRLFKGFGDMTAEDVAADTGLSFDAAVAAKSRQFSEPGRFLGTQAEKEAFLKEIGSHGIAAREGGRYLTLSFGATKADQMQALLTSYDAPPSLALGDAPNDVEMLEKADFGVIVANPDRSALPRLAREETGTIRRTLLPGPAGWNAEVLRVLSERGLI